MPDTKLPTFRKPPVIETVLGVQFEPVAGFTNAHLGAYWKWLLAHAQAPLDTEWSRLTDAPALEPAFERFEEHQSWLAPDFKMRVMTYPPARLQVRNASNDAMIQIQNSRLLYNWIGKPGQDYARYDHNVRPMFDSAYTLFRDFLDDEGLEAPTENQWEVTYVNHIPQGTVWQVPADWPRLFVGLPGPWAPSTDVRLEHVGGSWRFEISPKRGRLHIDLKRIVLQGEEPKEALRLTLTARGPIGESGTPLPEGLDLGRRTIVRTFEDITSAEAHRAWELAE